VVVDRQRHHPGLDVAAAHRLDDLERVLADEPDTHLGVPAAKRGDDVRAGVVARRPPGPERRDASAQLADVDDRRARRLRGGERRLGVRAQRLAGVGRRQPAPGPREQRDAELALEPADLFGKRRLGHVQLLRRAAERPVAVGGEEVLELLQRQGISLSSRRELTLCPSPFNADHEDMISLITFMAALGALDVMALRHGADSRRDVGRQL